MSREPDQATCKLLSCTNSPQPRKQGDLFPSPPILVAYGLESTSKTEVIVNVLQKKGIPYTLLRSRECLTQRHLLSKIFASCVSAFEQESQIEQYDRIDSINALLGNLRKLFERVGQRRFVVVIEGIDRLKQAGPTLLPALARLGDQIPGLSVLLTSNSPKPLMLQRAGVPYVHFPPYSRAEALRIITSPRRPRPQADVDEGEGSMSKLYAQFAITIYDSLISPTSSTSIETFCKICDKLWPIFIRPVLGGEKPPGTGRDRTWDFAKLLVKNRGLFHSEAENALHDTLPAQLPAQLPQQQTETAPEIMSAPTTPSKRTAGLTGATSSSIPASKVLRQQQPPLLKHFPTLVLLSSYLASHTAPKHDILLFSRLSSASSTTSKKIRRLRQTPTKRKTGTTPNATPSKTNSGPATPTKSRTKSIFAANANLGIPRPFTLERVSAILRAVHPHGIPNRPGRVVSDRVYRELGELEKLRLVVRTTGAGLHGTTAGTGNTGTAAADDITEEKWRVNVGRDWVVDMGHVWGMGVSEYEIEQDM
ncbi:hypothetical protein LTR20_007754 [Exophiala xenobiotica]|nr:hypothetical protein LTR41_002903 [Exophiala xenobiotica]KAK5281098.1 hypothetical protein LTR40_005381 [Exophiala xenobiotica]KAK5319449.1 hypothetical protein LTR93_007369 [Exophiala xenobiotica]KAK5382169.1 hypothetical protein LTS13_002832 [Exophiala xenobiotica]KAK5394643.1 hypothetical protein LTR79_008094 [Exophiala xenobiotica]